MKKILYTIILSFLFSSAYALDLNRSNKEFEKRQEENTKKLEDVLQLAEKCQDYICGKWRLSGDGLSATFIFYPTPNSDWEYEGIVFDNGNIGRFGFSKGDIVSHYNKIAENEYIGEDVLRSFFKVLAWMPTTVYLKNINTMTRINTPPPGIRVAATIQTGVRLGKKKSAPKKQVKSISKEELKLLQLLAEKGHAESQYNLGVLHYKGQGVIQDNVVSHMWFNISASNGDEDAVKLRDSLTKLMTPEQIAEANKLARECIKKNYKDCG